MTQQDQARRPRSPTTVQRCFGSQKQVGVDRSEDEFPEKLIASQVLIETKEQPKITKSQSVFTAKNEFQTRQQENISKGNNDSKDNGKKEHHKAKDDNSNNREHRKHAKGKRERSFLKLRTRGDVESDEETGSELELANQNFLHMPKNLERERAQRREDQEDDIGSRPRSKSPYSTKQAVAGPGLERNQGDFPALRSSKDRSDLVSPTRRSKSNASDDYKQCSPGRERRLAYSPPKITKSRSGFRSTSPESPQNSPTRRLISRSPSPQYRLRTRGIKKTLGRSSGAAAKATKSLGPRRRKGDQLDTARSGDRNGSAETIRTASDSRIISDLVMGPPGIVPKRVENAQYQRMGAALVSESSESEEGSKTTDVSYKKYKSKEKLPTIPLTSKSSSWNWKRSKSKAAPIPCSKSSKPCPFRRSRSRSRKSVHFGTNTENLSNDASGKSISGKTRTSSQERDNKHIKYKIPSPIFFNSRRCGAKHGSPDRTYWVPSQRFSPDRITPITTDQTEVNMKHYCRRPNLTGPMDFEKESTQDSKPFSEMVKGFEEDVLSKRSSQGDNVFPPPLPSPPPQPKMFSIPLLPPLLMPPPPIEEVEPVLQIEELTEKSNHDLDAQEKSLLKEKQLEDQEVKDSATLPTNDNLIKSQSLDENNLVHKSTSQVIDNILRMHSSQKSLKEGNGITTKPIVFPSLVTGPAAGQAEPASAEPSSSTKRSSTTSIMRDSAFYLAAQNLLKCPRKPTPGRSPPPGCGPSFSAGPGSLKDVRIRNDSRSPSPKKSVFTTFRTPRDYGTSLSFWNDRTPRRKSVSISKTEDRTSKNSSQGQRKPQRGRSPPPGSGIFSPGTRSPRETSRTELLIAKEPEPTALTKVENDDELALRNSDDADEQPVDEERDERRPSARIPKLPRPPIDDAPTIRGISESEIENRLRSSMDRKLSEMASRNKYMSEPESENHRKSKQRASTSILERISSVGSYQLLPENEEPSPQPKTQNTATQYEPMLAPIEENKETSRQPRRSQSIARFRVDENAQETDDRNDLLEENRRRSHSETGTKRYHDRCVEQASLLRIPVVNHKSAPRTVRSDPNSEPFERPIREGRHNIASRHNKNYSYFIPVDQDEEQPNKEDEGTRQRTNKRHSSDSSQRSRSQKSPEQREIRHSGHKRSTEPEEENRKSSVKDIERQREFTEDIGGHGLSSETQEENRRGSVKFQTPKFYPALQDDDLGTGLKRFKDISHYDDEQQTWSGKTHHPKMHRRRSSSESADSTFPAGSDRGKVKEEPRSSRGSLHRDKISSEPRKIREDNSGSRRIREDEPYQTSSQNFGTENSEENLSLKKAHRTSGSKKTIEARESRSSPPIAIRGHKALEILEKLPSVSTEDLTSQQKARDKKGNQEQKAKTRKQCHEKKPKPETKVDTMTSSSDLSSLQHKHKIREKAEKTKPRRSSTDSQKPNDDDKNSQQGELEEITSQRAEAESQALKVSNEEAGDVWSRQKWEKTVEEIMKRLAGRSKRGSSQGESSNEEGPILCCKARLNKESRDSPPPAHEIVYVVETPPPPDIKGVQNAKSRSVTPNSKTGAGTSGSTKVKPKSPVADKPKQIQDSTHDLQKSSKVQASDSQKPTKDKHQSKIAVPDTEQTDRKEEKDTGQSDKNSKTSDRLFATFRTRNSKDESKNSSGDKKDIKDSSSGDPSGKRSILSKLKTGDEKTKIEVLGNRFCGPCKTRRKRIPDSNNNITSNLSNPQKKIIENLFGFDISITPEIGTTNPTQNQEIDVEPINLQRIKEENEKHPSIDQMLQQRLMSPISQNATQPVLPVNNPVPNIPLEDEILKARLEEGPSDLNNREQLKLEELRRQQKKESLEKLSKLSFEQAMLKAGINRKEKIRALAAGRERRGRTASKTSPPFPGLLSDGVKQHKSIDDKLRAEKETPKRAPGVENVQLLRSENRFSNVASGPPLIVSLDTKIERMLGGIQLKEKKITELCAKITNPARISGSARTPSPPKKKTKKMDVEKEVLPMNLERLKVKSDNHILKLRKRDRLKRPKLKISTRM
ncbi:hypothetical protein GE061_014603 [Apolygus lucorum]|uniref:Uncharacterized protein n=1 Tax=Apolygus lucorum TaxID=248454 RepID=A0A8S9XKQ6_APOLU|nr:hypothetical protein GE061_014603 [Apolygus lucorum]